MQSPPTCDERISELKTPDKQDKQDEGQPFTVNVFQERYCKDQEGQQLAMQQCSTEPLLPPDTWPQPLQS